MAVVRLPMYDNVTGMELPEQLEVDADYFLTGPARHFGRIVQLPIASQEIEVIDRIIHGLPPKQYEQPMQWQDLDQGLDKFEINRAGDIRIKRTKKVLLPEWDNEYKKPMVYIRINGVRHKIDGPIKARKMWGSDG